jgi:hypothetical protein
MKRNLLVLGVLVCILALGMVFVSCDNGNGVETDTWSPVTSLDQLDGTWKGSYGQTMTIKEAVEAEGETWTSAMQTLYGDMKVSVDFEFTMTINATAETVKLTLKIIQTFSGGNIGLLWPSMSAPYKERDEVTVDDTKHSMTMEMDFPPESIGESDITDVQINQNETKAKVPAGLMDGDTPEIIFTRQ